MVRGEGGDRKGERDSRASTVSVEVGSSAAGLGAQDRAAVRTPSGKFAHWAKEFDFFL